MNNIKVASLLLAGFLQVAPVTNAVLQRFAVLPTTPVAAVLRWVVGALSIAGTYHTVSAASAVLASATKISGKVGTRLSYQIKVSDGQTRAPESWDIGGQLFRSSGSTTVGMPPGLSLGLGTGIISGTPTEPGTFPVTITAYEHPNRSGAKLTFTLTFTIAGDIAPPHITSAPASVSLHPGAPLKLVVEATGSGPLQYQWHHNGSPIADRNAAILTVNAVTDSDSGDYNVVVSGPGGSVTSPVATVTIVPLTMEVTRVVSQGMTLLIQTIPGQHYIIETAQAAAGASWTTWNEVTATENTLELVDRGANIGQRFWRCRVLQ